MSRKHVVKDRRTALWLGVGFTIAGSLLLYDAYEGRGNDRPWLLRWLPAG